MSQLEGLCAFAGMTGHVLCFLAKDITISMKDMLQLVTHKSHGNAAGTSMCSSYLQIKTRQNDSYSPSCVWLLHVWLSIPFALAQSPRFCGQVSIRCLDCGSEKRGALSAHAREYMIPLTQGVC